jgi:ribosomal protein L21E
MSGFHKGQKVKLKVNRGGETKTYEGEYVGHTTGAKGDWHEVKTADGVKKARLANISVA